MKTQVLCIGPVHGEIIYTTKTLDPNLLPQRLRSMVHAHASTQAQDVVFNCGGGGQVAATALSRLGVKTALLAQVGQDSLGCEAVRKLKGEGADISLVVQSTQAATSVLTILRSPQDDRFELNYIAPTGGFSKKQLAQLDNVQPDWLYVSGPFNDLSELKLAVSWAKKSGVQVAVRLTQSDIVQARKVIKLLSAVQICFFEADDAELLTHQTSVEESLVALRASGLRTVVVQDGVLGAYAVHDGFIYQTKPNRKMSAVNMSGVSEAFAPAVLAALLTQNDFSSALDFGMVAARAVANYVGSEAGLPKGFPHRAGKVDKKFL